MDDRRKTVAAISLIVFAFLSLAVLAAFSILRKTSVVSPIPEEGAIRIIFVSPTATPTPSPLATPTPLPKPKATATPKPTPTPTPPKAATSSASAP